MPRGGKRPGAGRKPGATPSVRSKPVYCGKLTQNEREQILYRLTPAARRLVLLDAVEKCESEVRVSTVNPVAGVKDLDAGG